MYVPQFIHVLVPHFVMEVFRATLDHLISLQLQKHPLVWWITHGKSSLEQSYSVQYVDNVDLVVVP